MRPTPSKRLFATVQRLHRGNGVLQLEEVVLPPYTLPLSTSAQIPPLWSFRSSPWRSYVRDQRLSLRRRQAFRSTSPFAVNGSFSSVHTLRIMCSGKLAPDECATPPPHTSAPHSLLLGMCSTPQMLVSSRVFAAPSTTRSATRHAHQPRFISPAQPEIHESLPEIIPPTNSIVPSGCISQSPVRYHPHATLRQPIREKGPR